MNGSSFQNLSNPILDAVWMFQLWVKTTRWPELLSGLEMCGGGCEEKVPTNIKVWNDGVKIA